MIKNKSKRRTVILIKKKSSGHVQGEPVHRRETDRIGPVGSLLFGGVDHANRNRGA